MLADWQGRAARVFVDAPCSGSGTWRRSPELRWRLTPARLERHRADQARLLDIAADLVVPGGKFLYAVCSIITREGRAQEIGRASCRERVVSTCRSRWSPYN